MDKNREISARFLTPVAFDGLRFRNGKIYVGNVKLPHRAAMIGLPSDPHILPIFPLILQRTENAKFGPDLGFKGL